MRHPWKLLSCVVLCLVLETLMLAWLQSGGSGRGVRSFDGPDNEEAIRVASASIQAEPKNPVPYIQRARALIKRNLLDDALRDCDKAIELSPTNSWAHFNRGLAREVMGDQARAMVDYNQACYLNSSNMWAFNNRAWILATSPSDRLRDASLAIESALHACELSGWKEWVVFMTLAAAYAESGDFDNAVHWQRRALAQLPDGNDEPIRLARRTFELFSRRTPVRFSYVNGSPRWN